MTERTFLEALLLLQSEHADGSMLVFGPSGPTGELRVGIRGDGVVELLIPVPREKDYPRVSDPGRLTVEQRPLATAKGTVRFLSLRPEIPSHLEPFARIADSLASRLAESGDLSAHIEGVIADFRALVSRRRDPDREAILGLFGELSFLESELRVSVAALDSWTGPLGTRHDFTNEARAAEIKTSSSPIPTRVTIHGLNQLRRIGQQELFLVVYGLEEVGEGGRSLEDLVQSVIENGADPGALSGRLEGIGMDPQSMPSAPRFIVRSRRIFEVDDHFPGLTATDSSDSAIDNVSYSLALGALGPFRVREDLAERFSIKAGLNAAS